MVSKGPAEGYQRKVTSVWRCCEPIFYTLLPLLAEYNYAKFQNCTIKSFWVIASQRKCWRTDGLTDKQGAVPLWTQNLYTFVSYCRVQLCKVSKLYDKNFLSYRITTSVIASRRKCWRTDGRMEPRIYTLLPLTVEYNCVKFQNCTIKTFWVIASQLRLSHHDENIDGQTNGRNPEFIHFCLLW